MDTLGKDSVRIVQADDDPVYCRMTEAFLRRAGYTRPVLSFPSGSDLVDFYRRNGMADPPEVILLDLNMPGLNGLEVIRWLKRHHPDIPTAIYIMSSSDNPVDICAAALTGANNYLLKTGRFDQLIGTIAARGARGSRARKPSWRSWASMRPTW
jgi:two-component system NarL family response regulator